MSNFAHNFTNNLVAGTVAQELRIGAYTVVVRERIAEGGFGFVDLVLESYSKQELVLKRCSIQSPESMEIVRKETHILQRFTGPNIVKLFASDIIQGKSSPTSKEALLLLEYCPGGHLLHRLNARKGVQLPANSIYRIFGQLLVALKPFHESIPPIVHRDLKLENILFGVDGNVRLCDFGSCVEGYIELKSTYERAAAEEIIAKETTQMYRAPEMIDLYMRDVLTEKTDIWALGCIMYAISFLSHPFQDAGSLGILSAKVTMPNESTISEDAKTLITRMLDMDPEARPSVGELFVSLSAIASGNPLPPFELSDIAILKKQERLEAAKRRDLKTQKKAKSVVPPRKEPASLSSNSVAARRLAAKKGVTGFDVSSVNSSSVSTGFANFGDYDEIGVTTADSSFVPDFASFDNSAPAVSEFVSSDLQSLFAFEPSNSSALAPEFYSFTAENSMVQSSSFDAFNPTIETRDASSVLSSFDPFAGPIPGEPKSTFDNFAPSASDFNPFTASVEPVITSFDFNASRNSSAEFSSDSVGAFSSTSTIERATQTEQDFARQAKLDTGFTSGFGNLNIIEPQKVVERSFQPFDPFRSSSETLVPQKGPIVTSLSQDKNQSYLEDDLPVQSPIKKDVLQLFDEPKQDPFSTLPSPMSLVPGRRESIQLGSNGRRPSMPVNPFLGLGALPNIGSNVLPSGGSVNHATGISSMGPPLGNIIHQVNTMSSMTGKGASSMSIGAMPSPSRTVGPQQGLVPTAGATRRSSFVQPTSSSTYGNSGLHRPPTDPFASLNMINNNK